MKILVVDPYLTDSHRVWLDGLKTCLEHHEVISLTLPARHWKWRMHSAHIELSHQLQSLDFIPDLIIATDMLDVGQFVAFTRRLLEPGIPIWVYFHENQMTYPVSVKDRDAKKNFDNHYAFINYSSAIIADKIIFNSQYHREVFMAALPLFLKKFPKLKGAPSMQSLRTKSAVIYPGFDIELLDSNRVVVSNKKPIILWNHRWEYDKNPEDFFEVMYQMADRGYAFDLAVMGPQFRKTPPIFDEAYKKLSSHIVQWGHVADAKEYAKWLWKTDLIISTSNQDFFGISVVEAIYAECYPLLPSRLAFPEHIPKSLQSNHLYFDITDLATKLEVLLQAGTIPRCADLATEIGRNNSKSVIAQQYLGLF